MSSIADDIRELAATGLRVASTIPSGNGVYTRVLRYNRDGQLEWSVSDAANDLWRALRAYVDRRRV